MALMPESSAVAAITNANWRYICPVMPEMKAAGRNTEISTSVMPMIGPINSPIASMAACLGLCPCSMCWATLSTTTMASSTTMPMHSTSANRVRKFTLNPSMAIAAKEPTMVMGTVVAGTMVARQFCRNTRMTISTSTPASNSVW